jgi:aryl-alcohol dehydrogenase-like predicted oxidoreductase
LLSQLLQPGAGKYSKVAEIQGHPRVDDLQRFFTPRGLSIPEASNLLAQQRQSSQTSVALAWLMRRRGIITSTLQWRMLVRAAELVLSAAELALLDTASI